MTKWRILESVFYVVLGIGFLLFLSDRFISGMVFLIGGLVGLVLKLSLKYFYSPNK